ncbi:hypothetical protein SFR_4172 [Streptomyces sp. FR-008]|nr:hypothetical protein SFR_4172 [Streptomyces sp. FR-008]
MPPNHRSRPGRPKSARPALEATPEWPGPQKTRSSRQQAEGPRQARR